MSKVLYYCDSKKNTKCSKSSCYDGGDGQCHLTYDEECRATGTKLKDMLSKYDKEDSLFDNVEGSYRVKY